MDSFQAFILGLIQGVSEFLPISSSAHLILLPKLTDLPDQGLAFDITVHFATLLAVILYYKKDIANIITSFFKYSPNINNDAKMGWGIILATIPVGICGLIFKDYIEINLRSTEVIAYTTIIFGLVLYLATFLHNKKDELKDNLTLGVMFIVGVFQALALIPGVSRSGVTITAGLLLGLSYKILVKFAFLFSIPVIVISMGLITLDLINTPESINWIVLGVGFFTAFMSAYVVIFVFLKMINLIGMLPFVVYRIILGVALLYII